MIYVDANDTPRLSEFSLRDSEMSKSERYVDLDTPHVVDYGLI